MKSSLTPRQKSLLEIIYEYIKDEGFPPSFQEMRERLGVSSNQSIMDLLEKLKKNGFIAKNESGARSLAILPLGYEALGTPPLVAFLGATAAGAPIEAMAIEGQWETVGVDLTQLQDKVFMLKIAGDSMINAGIDDGDVVLVKEHQEFVSGDVVLARIGDGTTVKRFISEDKPPYVYLKPENPKYPKIPFTDETELVGKVISVLKKDYWQPTK